MSSSSLNSLQSRKQKQRRFDAQNEAAARQIKASLGKYKPSQQGETEKEMMDRLMPMASSSSLSCTTAGLGEGDQISAPPSSSSSSSVLRPSDKPTLNENGNSNSLLTSMASRLTALEKSHRKLRSELVAKDREVLSWKGKYQTLAKATEEDGLTAAEQILGLEQANEQLRKQVHEMESFLQDYGLIWVGQQDDDATQQQQPRPEESAESIGARIDFGLLFTRLKELNVLAGEGKAKIHTEGRAARFDFGEKVPLAIFKDGIFIRRGPFRPYSDSETQRFVSDVLDGYFPPEFKDEYPDGIIFDVKDCSSMRFADAPNDSNTRSNALGDRFKAFCGEGQKVGALSSQTAPMSREDFLRRLPERSVRNGRVISIRDEISSMLESGTVNDSCGSGASRKSKDDSESGNSGKNSAHIIGTAVPHSLSQVGGEVFQLISVPKSEISLQAGTGVTIAQTPAMKMLKRSATRGELSADRDVTTLRIKLPGNGESLLAKMYFDDTVGDLRKHVAKHVNTHEFDLRAAFPSRTFRDDSVTLRDAGLVPNAKMFISLQKHK